MNSVKKTIAAAALTLALAPLCAVAAPSINVAYPQENEIITDKKIVIKGSASDPAGLTDLIINGRGFSLKQSKSMDFEKKVTLAPGGNSILVTAINSAGEITEREIFVQYTPPGVKPINPSAAAEKPVAAKEVKSEPPARPVPQEERTAIPPEKLGRLSESELVSSLPANAHNVSASGPPDQGEPVVEPGLMPLPAPVGGGSEKSPEPITEPSPALIKPYPGEQPPKKSEPMPEVVFPEKTEIEPIPAGKPSKIQPVAAENKKTANATVTQPASKPSPEAKKPETKPENAKAPAVAGKEQTQERKSPEGAPVVEKTEDDKKLTRVSVLTEQAENKPEPKKEPDVKKEADQKQSADDKKETKPSNEKKETTAVKASSKSNGAEAANKKETEKPQAVASADKANSSGRRVGGAPAQEGDIPQPKKAPQPSAAPKDNGLYTGECRVLAAGSYLYMENADAAAKDIAKNGYGSSLFEEKIGKTTIYHIVIGIYRTQADAESAAANFKLPGYKPAVSKTWCENVRFPEQKSNALPLQRDINSGPDLKLR